MEVMIKANGSQIITKLLELEGISTVAGIPGGSILPLYDELARSNIKHILVRHEQAAGFIAQGITRSTGKPAVCMATSGPGAMNLLTAIADARCDSVPVIAFTGQVNSSLIGTDAFQEADTFGLSFPITKHSVMVKDALELLDVIPRAFRIASNGRPGPVLIDVPRDVQLQTVEFEAWPDITSENKKPPVIKFASSENELDSYSSEIAKILLESKKCVLYLGGGCNNPEASEQIKKLLADYDAAVVTSLMGIGAFPRTEKNHFGMVGMHGSFAANKAVHDADTVLAMGVRFDDRATGVVSKFCPNARIIHIDIDAAEINKILPSCISAVCDVKEMIPRVIKKLQAVKKDKNVSDFKAERAEWLEELIKIHKETESVELGRPGTSKGINPRLFIKELPLAAQKAGFSPDDIIVTTDVGQHQMWSAQYYPVKNARQFLTSGSLGTMGFGLPAAIGAALANPQKRIICISGDGSILMNIQELATLAELNLNVTIVVFQNGTLGMVRQQQEYLFNKNYSASIFSKVPDFVKVAEGFSIDSLDVESDPDWEKKAFSKGPHLVRVHIEMNENVLPFVKAGSANIDAIRS